MCRRQPAPTQPRRRSKLPGALPTASASAAHVSPGTAEVGGYTRPNTGLWRTHFRPLTEGSGNQLSALSLCANQAPSLATSVRKWTRRSPFPGQTVGVKELALRGVTPLLPCCFLSTSPGGVPGQVHARHRRRACVPGSQRGASLEMATERKRVPELEQLRVPLGDGRPRREAVVTARLHAQSGQQSGAGFWFPVAPDVH